LVSQYNQRTGKFGGLFNGLVRTRRKTHPHILMKSWPQRKKQLAALLIFLLAAAGVSSRVFTAPQQSMSWADVFALVKREWPEVPQMTTQELARRMAEGDASALVLIDVRSRQEYQVSHLPGAVWAETPRQVEDVLKGRTKHDVIVLYCSAGVRSSKAAARLIKSGYTSVFNLKGSIFQWANERRPVLRDGKLVDVVHPYDERWGVLLDSQFHPKPNN
jgi:rhodanese-related sulfurtransferase